MSTQIETNVDQLQTRKTKKPAPNKPSASKTDLVLRSLNRKAGASVDELCKLTDWQPHSVQGFPVRNSAQKAGPRGFKAKGCQGHHSILHCEIVNRSHEPSPTI